MSEAALSRQPVGLSARRKSQVWGGARLLCWEGIGRIDPRPPLHAPPAIPNTRLSALMCLNDSRHASALLSHANCPTGAVAPPWFASTVLGTDLARSARTPPRDPAAAPPSTACRTQPPATLVGCDNARRLLALLATRLPLPFDALKLANGWKNSTDYQKKPVKLE